MRNKLESRSKLGHIIDAIVAVSCILIYQDSYDIHTHVYTENGHILQWQHFQKISSESVPNFIFQTKRQKHKATNVAKNISSMTELIKAFT